ncbi:MAG: hypothetical protein Tsb006_5170 [Rickettsiaceae bacterium]
MGKGALNKSFVIFAILLILFASAKLYVSYNAMPPNDSSKPLRDDLQVIIYAKDACSYCILAKSLLDSRSIGYEVIDLTNNKDLHLKLAEKTGQNTVPYLYINGEFIGGYSDLQKLDELGKL